MIRKGVLNYLWNWTIFRQYLAVGILSGIVGAAITYWLSR